MAVKLQSPIVITSPKQLEFLRSIPRCAIGSVRTKSIVSEVIRTFRPGFSSHSFGYEGKGCAQVVEASMAGVTRGSLKTYLTPRHKVAIYAYEKATVDMEEKLLARWQKEVDENEGYDWAGVFNKAFFNIFGRDEHRYYCSELMVQTVLDEWKMRIIKPGISASQSAPRDIDWWMFNAGLGKGWRVAALWNVTLEELKEEANDTRDWVWDIEKHIWTLPVGGK